LLEVVGALEGTIGHEIRDPVRGLSLGSRLFDEVAERLDIVAMAAEGLHEHGNPGLRLDDQLQHDVIEVRALVATLPLGDVHDVLRGQCVAVRTTITMQTRTVEVQRGWTAAQTRGGGRRNETVEFCHPVGIEDIQGTTERIIVELVGGNAGRKKSEGGLILEEPGDEGEGLVDKPQAIEPHRFDGLTRGEVPHFRVVLGRAIDDVANAELVEHASDKAEVVQDLATVWGVVGHNNLL
jgi:hypothetical protein